MPLAPSTPGLSDPPDYVNFLGMFHKLKDLPVKHKRDATYKVYVEGLRKYLIDFIRRVSDAQPRHANVVVEAYPVAVAVSSFPLHAGTAIVLAAASQHRRPRALLTARY